MFSFFNNKNSNYYRSLQNIVCLLQKVRLFGHKVFPYCLNQDFQILKIAGLYGILFILINSNFGLGQKQRFQVSGC